MDKRPDKFFDSLDTLMPWLFGIAAGFVAIFSVSLGVLAFFAIRYFQQALP